MDRRESPHPRSPGGTFQAKRGERAGRPGEEARGAELSLDGSLPLAGDEDHSGAQQVGTGAPGQALRPRDPPRPRPRPQASAHCSPAPPGGPALPARAPPPAPAGPARPFRRRPRLGERGPEPTQPCPAGPPPPARLLRAQPPHLGLGSSRARSVRSRRAGRGGGGARSQISRDDPSARRGPRGAPARRAAPTPQASQWPQSHGRAEGGVRFGTTSPRGPRAGGGNGLGRRPTGPESLRPAGALAVAGLCGPREPRSTVHQVAASGPAYSLLRGYVFPSAEQGHLDTKWEDSLWTPNQISRI